MKLLVVTTRSPYPLIEGRALRTFNLLKAASASHEIVLCTYVQSAAERDGLGELRRFCANVHAVPLYLDHPRRELLGDLVHDVFSRDPVYAIKYDRGAMARLVRQLNDDWSPDVLHLDMLHLGRLQRASGHTPTVLVEHNVESNLLRRRLDNESRPLHRAYLHRQVGKLRRFEERVCRAVNRVVAVSEVDAAEIRMLAPSTPVHTVANGVDLEYFRPALPGPPSRELVYVGGMSWFPNLDAIRHFVDDILPIIAREIPGVTLTVVGHPPPPGVAASFGGAAVQFTGVVDDIRPIVRRADAFVVPLRIGGGTRLKILDAMAMGKSVVTTTIGCEGLGVTDDVEVAIADGTDGFARRVVEVLRDREMAARLGAAARLRVEKDYGWTALGQRMNDVYAAAAAAARQDRQAS